MQKGFSFIELFVSLLLSSLVIMMLIRGLHGVIHQTNTLFLQIQRIEEDAWIFAFLRRSFHKAGFTACRRLDELTLYDARLNLMAALLPVTFTPNQLVLQRMSDTFAHVQQKIDATTLLIDVIPINKNYPLMIADCMHGEIHWVKTVLRKKGGLLITLQEPLFFSYGSDMDVGEWITESFFIKNQKLFYRYHHVDEISSDIQSMSANISELNGYKVINLLLKSSTGLSKKIIIYGRNA